MFLIIRLLLLLLLTNFSTILTNAVEQEEVVLQFDNKKIIEVPKAPTYDRFNEENLDSSLESELDFNDEEVFENKFGQYFTKMLNKTLIENKVNKPFFN